VTITILKYLSIRYRRLVTPRPIHVFSIWLFLLLAPLGYGLSIPGTSRAKLVYRSETIVIATVRDVSPPTCKLVVSKTLFGRGLHEISLAAIDPGVFFENSTGIFFLVKRGQHFEVAVPSFTYVPIEDLDNILQVIDMRVAPRKYFRDTRYALFSEYLDMLGFIFRDKDEFDGISRKAAIDYLRAAIKLPGRHNIIAVLDALRGLEIRDSRSVIPLLRNSDPVVRLYAVDFLIWAPHESAVEPLSDILDASDGSDPVLAKAVSRALTKINTAAAHRALQTAMKKGIITETSESRQ
jgi:hypothetical protein